MGISICASGENYFVVLITNAIRDVDYICYVFVINKPPIHLPFYDISRFSYLLFIEIFVLDEI